MEDGDRVVEDVIRNLEKTRAFDLSMRVRTSLGNRRLDFYGSFFKPQTKEVELAGMDADQAVTIELNHDRKLTYPDGVFIQVLIHFHQVQIVF